jgi:4-amino-4-deoxy-L-arabinose transferase-like glycosyltransferase
MFLCLPIASFIIFYLTLHKNGSDWRKGILAASVLWGTSVTAITEILSGPRLITRQNVAILWLAICIVGFLYLRVLRLGVSRTPLEVNASGEKLERVATGLLAATGVMALVVAITAVVSAPNVWDAMEYHLPRVMIWMSNHSVRFFATPDYAQLIFGPWAEYAMMHTYLLWGSDRLVNLIEFFSMLGSMVGVSLLAKMLGASPRGQVVAAVVCATITEGALEASGPMNTYVVAFWITTTVAFLLMGNEDPSWLNTILIGLSAGLALLTKGTAYVYLPFLVLACWCMGSRAARYRFLKRSPVFLLLILAINAPQFFRCYQLTGSPLGLPFPDGGPALHWRVDRISAQGIIANTLRNLSLHVVTPFTSLNARTEKMVRLAIRGIGANPDDRQTIWPGMRFSMGNFSTHEIHAGNPLHLVLLILSIGIVAWKGRSQVRFREVALYTLGVIGAFLLFCTLLRWQIWGSRHHLPLFVLGSPIIGLVLTHYFSRKIANGIVILLLAYTFSFTLVNRTRSLIPWSRVDDVYHPRSILYFSDQHDEIAADNIAAADALNRLDCRDIAIDSYIGKPASKIGESPKSFYVYPLMALIHADGRTRNVWYTGVDNWSSRYADQERRPEPCAVICLDCVQFPDKWAKYRSVGGRASVFDDIVVFSATGNVANLEHDQRDDNAFTDAPR